MIAAIGWPVLDRIRVGPLGFSPHGLGIAIGFLIGAWLLGKLGPRRGITLEHVNSIIFGSLIGAIIGARVFYVIAHYSEFRNLGEMLAVWRGGISLLGGIAGAVFINLPFVRKQGYRFFQVADPTAICLALGISIGRIGDLAIGDHLGKPTSWLLAWQYHDGTLAPPWVPGGTCGGPAAGTWQVDWLQGTQKEVLSRTSACLYDVHGTIIKTGTGVHQTALYDMVIAGVLFAILWRLSKKVRREGVLTLAFGIGYGLARLLEDSLRIDKRFGPLTGSQWTALSVATVSALTLIWWAFHPKPAEPPEPADEPANGESAEPVGPDVATS
ncbi:MAG: prolipoprotein diacylglyceryl transferase [Actinomycetota bacterium]|nr:prolipoprotein diacylglyceryl transferase [Actinomycetota bacterium]